MSKKSVQIQQLNRKMLAFVSLQKEPPPPQGWLKSVRMALGMSLQQLSNRLSITKQSMQEFEFRENDGSITIKSLREAAKALDMQLVYGFVPVDGSMEELINRKAKELATQIVLSSSNNMMLGEQEILRDSVIKAIEEKAIIFKHEMPKALWD